MALSITKLITVLLSTVASVTPLLESRILVETMSSIRQRSLHQWGQIKEEWRHHEDPKLRRETIFTPRTTFEGRPTDAPKSYRRTQIGRVRWMLTCHCQRMATVESKVTRILENQELIMQALGLPANARSAYGANRSASDPPSAIDWPDRFLVSRVSPTVPANDGKRARSEAVVELRTPSPPKKSRRGRTLALGRSRLTYALHP